MKTKSLVNKINVVTLGCAKNLVDSEVLMRQLEQGGIELEHNAADSDAKTVIINTCGFIQDAKQESIDTILDYVRAKEEGGIENLYVMGCLSERYKNELLEEIPEVDQYFGVHDLPSILGRVGVDYRKELAGERKLATPSHYAYLKVSEGCDRKCAFCAIPLIRGPQVSRSLEDLVEEAGKLVSSGVRELILIAQDLTAYGTDLYGKRELAVLLDHLLEIKELAWIRLHYTYPVAFPEDVLDRIAENARICKYLDIPFQHVADPVLKNMLRGINKSESLELLSRIRTKLPGAAVRTTIMTGHPGEGHKEFEELKEFVRHARFERLGGFIYSEEEGTWGAEKLRDSIPENEKLDRLEEIMQIQQAISHEINQSRVGEILKVIIDRKEGDYYIGRTEYDSPEVDNEVLVQSGSPLKIGEFCNVHIKEGGEFDLVGFAV